MTKSSFLTLCGLFKPYLVKQKVHLTVPVPPEKQIPICLYKLASCAEYRVVRDVFGVHKSTVHKYFYIALNGILKLTKDFVKFPKLEECLQTAKRFEKISNIPNLIGSIDGKYSHYCFATFKRIFGFYQSKGLAIDGNASYCR